jgi:hypothetical protein
VVRTLLGATYTITRLGAVTRLSPSRRGIAAAPARTKMQPIAARDSQPTSSAASPIMINTAGRYGQQTEWVTGGSGSGRFH